MLSTKSTFAPEVADDEDSLDAVVARADTFVMGDGGDEQAEQYFVRKSAPKYLQGLIQAQQVHLVTNLSGAGSVTLAQAQMVWTLGRNREAGIPIHDRMMSRRHASIIYIQTEKTFYLLDLNSMNGSYVNGVRVQQRQILQDGDFLRVGNTEFFFFISGQYECLEPMHPEVHGKFISFIGQSLAAELNAEPNVEVEEVLLQLH
jgi:pSer/pThr/pTyr-binding forkhead associated (FHA) protein